MHRASTPPNPDCNDISMCDTKADAVRSDSAASVRRRKRLSSGASNFLTGDLDKAVYARSVILGSVRKQAAVNRQATCMLSDDLRKIGACHRRQSGDGTTCSET